jgi:hypothetical protein
MRQLEQGANFSKGANFTCRHENPLNKTPLSPRMPGRGRPQLNLLFPISRIATFFLSQYTQTGKNIPNNYEIYQKVVNYSKWPQNIPNSYETYQMVVNYSKWPQNIPILSFPMPSKIYPNRDFLVWEYIIWQPCRSLAPSGHRLMGGGDSRCILV